MENPVTPSVQIKTMTPGQIDKAVANYRAMLEKHALQLDSEAVQTVLGQSELADQQFVVFRKRVEAQSNMIIRRVLVDRNRTPQQVLDATGCKQCADEDVLKTMPKGEGDEIEVIFFTLGRYVSDDNLEKEYGLRGLQPVDPYSLAAVNEKDPTFVDAYPNVTHWRNNRSWNFVTFFSSNDGPKVNVSDFYDDYDESWWFAGVRKIIPQN